MPIKQILVPVDFSPAMDCVVTMAREMAGGFGATIHLIYVREIAAIPVFPAATIGYPGVGMPEMAMTAAPSVITTDLPDEKGKSRLDTLAEELIAEGLEVSAHEPEGTVVSEILRVAKEIPADLIVMGSHGHGMVYNLLVGSVTEGVLKAGHCPVLLVPAPALTK